MIQVNLLPDIKLQYLKSQRVKRLFIVGSILAAAVFAAVAILVGLWVGAQRLHLSGVQNDIDQTVEQLKAEADLSKIVTIQKQLERLPELHNAKLAMHRLFDYIGIVVPNEVSLNTLELDAGNALSMEIRGRTTDIKMVNVFVDTLKNANFRYGEGFDTEVKPFNDVRVQTYGLDDSSSNKEGAAFTVLLVFDSVIFDNKIDNLELVVPSITSSPSVTERPGNLFVAPPEDEEEAN